MTPKTIRLLIGALAASGALAAPLGALRAETLADALQAARARDPALTAARAQAEASRARIGVVGAAGATTAGVSGAANAQYAEINSDPGRSIQGGTGSIGVNVPLYRPQVGVAVGQAGIASRVADVQSGAAEQDLMLRVSLAYLEVLAAIENLRTLAGQKASVAAQLASARRSFEVGTATIVDPNEAQSRFDAIVAQEITASAELAVRRAALAQLTGASYDRLRRLPSDRELPPLRPSVLDEWLERALELNPAVRRARLEQEIAEREIERRSLGRRPSLDAVGSVGREVNPSPMFGGLRTNSALLGLQFNWPLWDGGAVDAGVREALALAGKSGADVETAERAVDLEVRRLFRKLGSGLAVVSALRAAERSAEVALRSMQRAQEVGVRVTTDVLNAQQQLFVTRRDLARAR